MEEHETKKAREKTEEEREIDAAAECRDGSPVPPDSVSDVNQATCRTERKNRPGIPPEAKKEEKEMMDGEVTKDRSMEEKQEIRTAIQNVLEREGIIRREEECLREAIRETDGGEERRDV